MISCYAKMVAVSDPRKHDGLLINTRFDEICG